MSSGAPGPDRSRSWFDRSAPFGAPQILVSVAIASVGLALTALFAFSTPGASASSSQDVPAPGPTVTETVTVAAGPAMPTGSVTASVTPSAPAEPDIWHEGDVTMHDQTAIDVDSPATDNQWSDSGGAVIRIYAQYQVLSFASNSDMQLVTHGAQAYPTCNTTGFIYGAANDIPLATLTKPNTVVCIKTQSHMSSLVVKSYTPGSNPVLKVHIKTWATT